MAQMEKILPEMQEIQVRSLGWGRSPGEGNGYPLRYFCLENSMDRGAWSLVGYSLWGCKELDSTEHACRVK